MYRLAVIPARWASTRFPGKPLVRLNGVPMIHHVMYRCKEANCFDKIVVATDDSRIASAVPDHALMTSADCASGTDRAAEVARAMPQADIIVNVQGDEPAVPPAALRHLTAAFDDPKVQLATLVRPLDPAERANPNVVKVVLDQTGHALYFSRADIPFERNPAQAQRWAHVGLYGYRRDALLALAALPPTTLEKTEGLEQLRALGAGMRMLCRTTNHHSRGVDTPADVAEAEAALEALQT